jgi:hypothetical protein
MNSNIHIQPNYEARLMAGACLVGMDIDSTD